jgi:hypothetical protein
MITKRSIWGLVALVCIGFLGAAYVQAQMPPPIPGGSIPMAPPGQQMPVPQPAVNVERVSPGVFRLGDIRIDKEARAVIFPASVNMDKGLLEYLIVTWAGKTHESLLRTRVQPYHLQIALLLLGLEGTDRPISAQGAQERPKGDPVEIMIEYSKDFGGNKSQILTARAEQWFIKKMNDNIKETGRIEWVFTGSMITEGQFVSQRDGSIIAIYRDPVALIDNASEGGDDDEIWFVKEGTVPAVGTPVTVTIRAKR